MSASESTLPVDQSTVTAETKCSHCSAVVPPEMLHPENEQNFCCYGCQTAWQILNEDAELAAQVCQDRVRPEEGRIHWEYMDHASFQAEHVQNMTDSRSRICFYLEGMHCASCVLVIEKLPRFLPGVLYIQVNYLQSSVSIQYDPADVKVSEIAAALDRLGYRPHSIKPVNRQQAEQWATRRQLISLAIAGAAAGNTMLIAIALYCGFFTGMTAEHETLFRYASALLAAISLFGPGRQFFTGALRAIRTRTSHIDLPIAVGLSAGAVMGLINTVLQRGEVYFDSLTVLVFLLLVGRFLQFQQQRKSVRSLSLLKSLTPRTAIRLPEGIDSESRETVPVEAVQVEDLLLIAAGDLIPADGLIVEGSTEVDCSMLTGEADGVPVGAGAQIFAGCTNLTSPFVMRAEKIGEQTRLAELTELVATGVDAKIPMQQFANRIAGYFTVVVMLLATITVICWAPSGYEQAVNHAIALLIVACPCALGIATPLTVAIAQGRAARTEILIKAGDVFEKLNCPGDVWFDKTGTLTTGQLELKDWQGETDCQQIVIALEASIVHPVAKSLVSQLSLRTQDQIPVDVDSQQVLPGLGVQGRVAGDRYLVGSPRLIPEFALSISSSLQQSLDQYHQAGWTGLVIAREENVIAVCGLEQEVRSGAEGLIQSLQRLGWNVGILSGDHPQVVQKLAVQLGVPQTNARGQVTPEQKLQVVSERNSERQVVMIGDGVNDSAALAAASVGIAVQGGAATSLAAADVYLKRPQLQEIEKLFTASRQTVQTIHRNFAISLGYNLLAVGLAMTGWIHPFIAAILMPVSSLSVMLMAGYNPAFRRNES